MNVLSSPMAVTKLTNYMSRVDNVIPNMPITIVFIHTSYVAALYIM